MITYFDLIPKSEFRDFVSNRIASSTGNSYSFPIVFPKLYKYRPLSSYLVNDIVNQEISLSSIGEFNDIFDGAIHQYGSKEEIEKAAELEWMEIEKLRINAGIPKGLLKKEDIVTPYIEYLKTDSRLKFRELDYLGTYVYCFSEENDSILMWSHYADSNKGVCIEYDFNKLKNDCLIRKALFPVSYTKTPIDVSDLIEEDGKKVYQYPKDAAVLCTALNKADIWNYEREWRMVWVIPFSGNETQRLPLKISLQPSKIYLGYHFLKPFFYYKDGNQSDIIRGKINNFMKLIEYIKSNNIQVAIMAPSIGSYNFKPCDVPIDVLIKFMQEHFVDRQPSNIRFYYTLHDRLFDLLEKVQTDTNSQAQKREETR